MGDTDVESRAKIFDKFDLENELSSLVEKKVISRRIADRLEKKLNEKKVNISKEQLQILVKKIGEIVRTYSRSEKPLNNENEILKVEKNQEKKSNTDMNQLIETVEKMKQKLSTIETGIAKNEEKNKTTLPKIVTTDDIKIPKSIETTIKEFEFEPLTEIPNDPENIIVLMRWLQYLIDKCGHINLSTILDYYIDIRWISQDAKLILIDYSNGITEDNSKREIVKREIIDLPSKDHIQSLFFIQKLKGKDIDKHFIDRIDGELTRITKKLDNYHFK
jgi:flagellar protein FlaE